MDYFVWKLDGFHLAPYFWYLLHKKTQFWHLENKKWYLWKYSEKTLFGNIAYNIDIHLCAKYGHIITNYATGMVVSWSQVDKLKFKKLKSVFAVCKHTAKNKSLPCANTRQRVAVTAPSGLPFWWAHGTFLCRVSVFTVCIFIFFTVCPTLPCVFWAISPCIALCRVPHTAKISLPCARYLAHGKDRRHTVKKRSPVVTTPNRNIPDGPKPSGI